MRSISELEGETIRIEELENKLRQINNWIKAYPLKMFPEPDFKKVKEALKSNGLSLDEVGASYMRYVLQGVARIIEGETDSEARK